MFTAKVETLRGHVRRAQGAIEKANVRPILANFLLDLEGNALRVIASNNDLQVVETCEVGPAGDAPADGRVTVNANKLQQALAAALPTEDATLTVDGSSARLHIANSVYVLQTMPADEYPVHEEGPEDHIASLVITQKNLRTLLNHVHFSMAVGNHRYYLNGMFWSIRDDEILAVATNGHRMAIDTAKGLGPGKSNDAIIPRQTVLELHRLLEDSEDPVTIEVFGQVEGDRGAGQGQDAARVRVSFGSTVMLSQVIQAKYPDHERVVPKSNENRVVLDRQLLRGSLRRVAVVNDEREYAVNAKFDSNALTVQCKTTSGEEGTDEISLVNHEGGALEITFSGVYLEEVLDHLEEPNVRMALKDAQSSVLITPDAEESEFKYILMPVRS